MTLVLTSALISEASFYTASSDWSVLKINDYWVSSKWKICITSSRVQRIQQKKGWKEHPIWRNLGSGSNKEHIDIWHLDVMWMLHSWTHGTNLNRIEPAGILAWEGKGLMGDTWVLYSPNGWWKERETFFCSNVAIQRALRKLTRGGMEVERGANWEEVYWQRRNGGEYEWSTLYMCMEAYNEAHYYV